MNRPGNVMKINDPIRYLLVLALLGLSVPVGLHAEADEHAGHDHAAHADAEEPAGEHDDHKAEADDHDGEDHDKHAEEDDDHGAEAGEHAGHDHDAHEAKEDGHAGHDGEEQAGHDDEEHAEAEEDEHAGHDHAAHADAEEPAGEHDDNKAEADDHAGHDHAAHTDAEEDDDHGAEADEHAGHDHGGQADAEEEGLRLTEAQWERFGIKLQAAGPGALKSEVSLPGEIVFNEDRIAHVVPRVPGIARKVFKTVGDRVKSGDPLALIDSAELAAAKLDYFSAASEVSCCQFELPRAQAIHDNTVKMLAVLETSPAVDQLRKAAPGEMGAYRSRLISAYAEYAQSQQTYTRESALVAQKISSQGDFLAAEAAFKKAQAEYFGTRDSVAFEIRQGLLEARRDRQLLEFGAETKRQRLLMLGLSEAELVRIMAAATPDTSAAHTCTDPNCKDCPPVSATPTPPSAATLRLNATELGSYSIVAPFAGAIVNRHITLGEHVDEDAAVFTVVDTASVWAKLAVHTRNLAAVQVGQDVVLKMDHSDARIRGRISMVTPFVDEATRSASARVVLDNQDGRWTPGTFVTGFISNSEEHVPVVVARQSVQNIEGRNVVFVEHEGAFEMTPVTLGRTDRTHVEVLAGLPAGTSYVAEGAFQLKATAVTSNLDSHAGHGH